MLFNISPRVYFIICCTCLFTSLLLTCFLYLFSQITQVYSVSKEISAHVFKPYWQSILGQITAILILSLIWTALISFVAAFSNMFNNRLK